MRPFSEREQLIWDSLNKEGAITMGEALGLAPGDYNYGSFQTGARVMSILSDRQVEVIKKHRANEYPPRAPLLADLVEVIGARSGQVIDENSGFIFPGDDFEAHFNIWKAGSPAQKLRSNRNTFSKYVLEPRMTLVYPS